MSSVLLFIMLSILNFITEFILQFVLATMLFSANITRTNSCNGSNWFHCCCKGPVGTEFHLHWNVFTCSTSRCEQTRHSVQTFSGFYNNWLPIQDLINVPPNGGNKLFRHIKHTPLSSKLHGITPQKTVFFRNCLFTYVILSHPLHNSVSLPIPSLSCVQFIMIVFISVKVLTLNTDILTVKQLVR